MSQSLLLIDDSAAVQTLLRARLKDEPIVIHCASDGQAGLKMAAQLVPDLILLDVDMPQPDGFEVCRLLKSDPGLIHVPIIFLTGAASPQEKIRGLELGAIDYITKPFDPAELRARVRAALRLKFMMDLLAQKAQIDALTGLWNRRYFDERLEAEVSMARRAPRPLAVLMIDIDKFKLINDTYGHATGDEVLRRVACLLGESVRTEDIVCRYGGEEFAVIAPNTCDGAAALAERLRHAVETMKITFLGKPLHVTASIGVASHDQAPETSLVAQADAALYRAKQAGRNRVEVTQNQPSGLLA
jgi:diguanylate cyclase (GGDEF)-like protein